jgi:hypothetical protein
MLYSPLNRWSGVTLIVGGILGLAYLVHPLEPNLAAMQSPSWIYAHGLAAVGLLLITPGLTGLYLRMGEGSGILGLLGYFLASIASASVAGLLMWIESILLPVAASNPAFVALTDPANEPYRGSLALPMFLISAILFVVGYVLLGIAMLRTNRFPRFVAYLIIAGGVLFAVPVPPAPVIVNSVGMLLLGVALISAGYTILRDARQTEAGSKLAVGMQP